MMSGHGCYKLLLTGQIVELRIVTVLYIISVDKQAPKYAFNSTSYLFALISLSLLGKLSYTSWEGVHNFAKIIQNSKNSPTNVINVGKAALNWLKVYCTRCMSSSGGGGEKNRIKKIYKYTLCCQIKIC